MNKKGHIMDIIIWTIVGFVTILFLGLWVYGTGLMTDAIMGLNSTTSRVNITSAAEQTFLEVYNAEKVTLEYVAFAIIFASAISIFISNFLVKSHPAFFIIYVLIIIVAVIFGVYVSNAYEELLTHSGFGTTLQSFEAPTFVMLHLPIWIVVIGFFGAIFLFVGISRDREMGGSPI
jgi:hypothetical protein